MLYFMNVKMLKKCKKCFIINLDWNILIFLYKNCIYLFIFILLMWQEFVDFIAQNNVVWVAIWLLIATKVGEWTKSFIEDFVTPLIFSPILKKLKIDKLEDLSWRWVLYWKLLARTIDFIVVALVVFLVIKWIGIETA